MFESKKETFRIIAKIEGISYLLLFFVAMPLKYMAGILIVTKIVGMAHGGLWIMYLWFQAEASKERQWGIKFNLFAFIMSLLPFGTFYLNNKLKEMDVNPALESN